MHIVMHNYSESFFDNCYLLIINELKRGFHNGLVAY